MGMGKILDTSNKMTWTMTHNILLTRLQGFTYLLGVGSRRTRTVNAMNRQRREG